MSRLSIDDIAEVVDTPIMAAAVRTQSLPSGDALNRAQASILLRRRISHVVAIIGPNNAGKTSLLASVYDLLQDGPVAEIGFAGSSTLIGFEKVCHDARAASRRDRPHTERTSAGADATFFHLDLRPAEGDLVSLFIGDRSGEDYLGAADHLSRAEEFFELRRADVVTVLVNGEHLTSSEHRHEAKAMAQQMVDALVESGSIRRGSRLAIVLTKQDCVLESPHAQRAEREFYAMADSIVQSHGGHFGEIERFIVAASPKDTSTVKRGAGVDQLLLFWLRPNAAPPPVQSALSRSTRMMDLLDSNEAEPA